MLFDTEVVRLSGEVAKGSMTALAALLDRLHEIGDRRVWPLARATAMLQEKAENIGHRDKGTAGRRPWSRSSQKEAEYRREQACLRAWSEFANHARELFWGELSGRDTTALVLEEVQRCLDTEGLATRASREPEDEGEMSEEKAPWPRASREPED